MATAALTVVTFWLAFKKWAESIPARGAALGALCVLLVVALLAYQPTTTYSHSVMTETLSSFGTAVGVFGLIAALGFMDNPVPLSAAFVLGTIGSVGAFYTRPPALGVTLGVWLGLFAVLYASRAISTRSKLMMSALVIAFVAVVMVIPENRLQKRYGNGSLVMAETLFCNHANIVIDVVPRVVRNVEAAHKLEGILDDTLKHGPEGWPLLGFDGDRCVYLEDLQSVLDAHFGTAVGWSEQDSHVIVSGGRLVTPIHLQHQGGAADSCCAGRALSG
jgi:protein-S-isoprenylcysteine O-methyltransferase Ste14